MEVDYNLFFSLTLAAYQQLRNDESSDKNNINKIK